MISWILLAATAVWVAARLLTAWRHRPQPPESEVETDAGKGFEVEGENEGLGWDYGKVLFGRVLAGLIIAWILWIIFFFAWNDKTTDPYTANEAELLVLQDDSRQESDWSGAFVLAIGVAGGSSGPEWKYTWYQRSADGEVRLREEDADSDEIAIFEDAKPGAAYVVERWTRTTSDTPDWLAPMDDQTDFDIGSEYQRTELHVPPGTVERDLQLDAR